MEVAVLRPQDCLTHRRHRHLTSRRNPNPNPTRSTRRRRSSPTRSKSPPVMGQIRILKRGEDLSPPRRESEPVHIPLSVTGVFPDGFYAGSTCVTSPPPSEVPVPAFFTKRNDGFGEANQNHEIASELRKVLKLI